MSSSKRIAPLNSLVFISDPDFGVVPEFVPGIPILSTPSCISVGYLMWQDGLTDVTLGLAHDVDPGQPPAFDGNLETPNRAVVVLTLDDPLVLRQPVRNARTRVRIWVNRLQQADQVIVGVE
jgi:hypothetical protein